MRPKDLLAKMVGMVTPPPLLAENDRRRASTLYFLLLLMLVSFTILILSPVRQELKQIRTALYVADGLILFSLILARLGNITLPSYIVPFGLLAVNTYIIFYRRGANDITILGLPVIIALGGLLLGRRAALTLTGLSILCYSGIVWAELNGLTPNTADFARYLSPDDLIVAAVLLVTTAVLIFFIMRSLSLSLEKTLKNEHALEKANESLQHSTVIMEHRTGQLLIAAKVSRAASTILEPDELCQQVVDMVRDRFDLYYVSLFLVDEKGEWATLYAGTGEAGRVMLQAEHRLQVGSTSMIGWCIANQKARIALDVGSDAVRFDNPLLPDTRSELALPLISRTQVIGALGIQSNKEAAFSQEDITIFQAMADQVANAISNARLYDQLERELAERKRVEKEIRTLNAELEGRVDARTRELLAANENLRTLSRLKDEFLSNVSHELRTPLTSITLYHNMLEKQPQLLGRTIDNLNRETSRLAQLIENLLYLSRLDQGYAPINPVPLDLNRLAHEYVEDRSVLASERGLTLTFTAHEGLPFALADEQMTGQVLSAILTNALNYTPTGGYVTITTQAQEDQGQMWTGFSIRDTGTGITVEEQKRLFERFFRGRTGRTSATPGTGLGLAIVREIISRHGGRIEVQSEGIPGKGTTFFVWLPVA